MMLMTGGRMAIITSQLINESVRTITGPVGRVRDPPMALLFWLSTVSALIVYGVDDDLTLTAADDGRPGRTEPGGNTEDRVDDVFGVNGDDGPTDGGSR